MDASIKKENLCVPPCSEINWFSFDLKLETSVNPVKIPEQRV